MKSQLPRRRVSARERLAWRDFVPELLSLKCDRPTFVRFLHSSDDMCPQGTLPEDLGNLGSKLILEEIK